MIVTIGLILIMIGVFIEIVFFETSKDILNKFDEETKYRIQCYLLIFSIVLIGVGLVLILKTLANAILEAF